MTTVGEAVNAVTRPLVTIFLVGMLAWGFIQGKLTGEQVVPIVTMVIGFWFGQRNGEQVAASAASAAAERVVAKTVERRAPRRELEGEVS